MSVLHTSRSMKEISTNSISIQKIMVRCGIQIGRAMTVQRLGVQVLHLTIKFLYAHGISTDLFY